MTEICRMTVCAGGAAQQWDLDEWTVVVAIAALSAEPETIDELLEAMRRYLPRHELLETGRQASAVGAHIASPDPWCLIELTGRTLLAGGGFELPEPRGAYRCDEEDLVDGFPAVWLETPSDWLFAQAEQGWQQTVQSRAAAAASRPRRDLRAVLFGLPLLEHLAEGVLRERSLAAAGQPGGRNEYRELDPTQRIHAEWLMTPRDDLGNRTPRQVLLHDRQRIQYDLEHRAQQWSLEGHAPPQLSTESAAYRYGSFGTSEVVLCFDLIRALLSEGFELIEREPQLAKELLVARLAARRDQWLDSPSEESGGSSTPREMIELERRRMPATDDGSHLDCDCPLCLAMATDGVPTFMWFDGHHLEMEDVFAFSLSESRKEWELEHWHYRDLPDESEPESESEPKSESESKPNRAPSAGESPRKERDELDSVWKSSHVDWEQATLPHAPPGFSVLAIGFPLAELVSDLKQLPDGQRHLEGLNRAFLSFRQAQSAIVMQSRAEDLCSRLEAVAQAYPQLVCKSADLQSHVHEVMRACRY